MSLVNVPQKWQIQDQELKGILLSLGLSKCYINSKAYLFRQSSRVGWYWWLELKPSIANSYQVLPCTY